MKAISGAREAVTVKHRPRPGPRNGSGKWVTGGASLRWHYSANQGGRTETGEIEFEDTSREEKTEKRED